MPLGYFPIIEQKPEWLPLVESLKIFGVHFGEQAKEKNEGELFSKIAKSLNAFKKTTPYPFREGCYHQQSSSSQNYVLLTNNPFRKAFLQKD